MKINAKKIASAITAVIFGMGVAGASISTAEAAKKLPRPPHAVKYQKPKKDDTFSEGERNTAAIAGFAVGAIVGAVVANNT